MKPFLRTIIALIAVASVPVLAVEGQSLSLVSPSGLEDVDGNMLFMPAKRPYPQRGPLGPDGQKDDGWKAQELHLASVFESHGRGPFTITGMAWRPDISVNEPISTTWELTLRLSTTTTQPGSLQKSFADNHGDDVTLVFSGKLQLATDGLSRGRGLPHEFDYAVQFDTPYRYSPARGNLLVEFVSRTEATDTWAWVDADSRVSGFVFGTSAEAEEALHGAPGLFVTRFDVVTKSLGRVPSLRPSQLKVCRVTRRARNVRTKLQAGTTRRFGCRWPVRCIAPLFGIHEVHTHAAPGR